MAVYTWGSLWQRKRILFHCENHAVVDINFGLYSCKRDHGLLYFAATFVCAVHIDGTNNVIADCLSRFKQERFKQLAPLANSAPDNIPAWPIQSFIEASSSAAILV